MDPYSNDFYLINKNTARYKDSTGYIHETQAWTTWTLPLHALENQQGHNYLPLLGGKNTKRLGRFTDLTDAIKCILASNVDDNPGVIGVEDDYTDEQFASFKVCKGILWIPKLRVYECRRCDIVSNFAYERQVSALRNLQGVITFMFDPDRLHDIASEYGYHQLHDDYYKWYNGAKAHIEGIPTKERLFDRDLTIEEEEVEPQPEPERIRIKKKKKKVNSKPKPKSPYDLTKECDYEKFGLNKDTATWNDVRKVYKRMMMIYHPDKGGNEEDMKIVNCAYERIEEDFAC